MCRWRGSVASSWTSEGEPDWDGEVEAYTIREAVYQVMLEFCKVAGRVYPGYSSRWTTSPQVYDRFDVQGTIYLSMLLPNGTTIPVDRSTIDDLKSKLNKKAPMPKTPKTKTPKKTTATGLS